MSSTHWSTVSTWSKAGVGTCIVLELKDPPPPPPPPSSSSLEDAILHHHQTPTTTSSRAGPRIVFDVGATPCFDDAIPAKYVFLSHGHIDHVGALFSHARAHAMTCGG
jgi:glyoxylase-like metal-dependent hydrolase (beta-lactamase superfamily II)